MQTYTQQHIDEMLSEVDQYFSEFTDREKHFWVLSNVLMPEPTARLTGGKSFGSAGSVISIIDPFDGRKPAKLYRNYKTAEYEVGFQPTLILDSQLVAYLRQYVGIKEGNTNIQMNDVLYANVESFLRFAVESGFDYNPFFYYIESSAKDSSGNFHETAVKDAEAILKLHSMDEERFLKTGEIVTDPNLLKDYEDDFGGKSLEETARARSQDMLCSLNGVSFPLEERVIQALLLKMTIIKRGKGGILEKLKMLREFMEDELNVVLTPEYYLAIFYFSDSTGNFIPNIQKKVNIERAFVKIQATTWDLLLLRIPAMQLKMHSDDYTQLGFISTADSSFAKIASQFIIGGIIPLPHNKTIDCDVFLYKQEKIIEILGADSLALFERFNYEKTKYRQIGKLHNRTTGKPEKKLNLAELDNLTEELKDKFRNLCRK